MFFSVNLCFRSTAGFCPLVCVRFTTYTNRTSPSSGCYIIRIYAVHKETQNVYFQPITSTILNITISNFQESKAAMSPISRLKSTTFRIRKRYVFLCQSRVPINKKLQEYVVMKYLFFTPLKNFFWSLCFLKTIFNHFLNKVTIKFWFP